MGRRPTHIAYRKWVQRERRRRRRAQAGVCYYCNGKVPEGMGVLEHKIPICRGGSVMGEDNLAFACRSCDKAKGEMTAKEFKKRGVVMRWAKIVDKFPASLRRDASEALIRAEEGDLVGLLRAEHSSAEALVSAVFEAIGLDIDDVNLDPEQGLREQIEKELSAEIGDLLPESFAETSNWFRVTEEVKRCVEGLESLATALAVDEEDLKEGEIAPKVGKALVKLKIVEGALGRLGIEGIGSEDGGGNILTWSGEETRRIARAIDERAERIREAQYINILIEQAHGAVCPERDPSLDVRGMIQELGSRAEKQAPPSAGLGAKAAELYFRITGEEHVDGDALDVEQALTEMLRTLGAAPKF